VYGRWYGGGGSQPWNESTDAARSLRAVNSMHRRVAQAIETLPLSEFERRLAAQFPHISDMQSSDPQVAILFKDLAVLRAQFRTESSCQYYRAYGRNQLKFTQFDMLLVQWAFVFGPLLYPDHYGCQVYKAGT
jgi:hypothetical protein